MQPKEKIKNSNKSRRGFLSTGLKAIYGSVLVGTIANIFSTKNVKAQSNNSAKSPNSSDPFVGEIMMAGFNFPPRGWSSCDGQLLSINSNSALFSLLGTIYGGDGRTSFGLPDLRGRVPIHYGAGTGLSGRNIGEKGGSETTALTVNNLPAHNHSIKVFSGGGNSDNPNGNFIAANSEGIKHYSSSSDGNLANSNSVSETGSGTAFNNMPPFLVLNFVIALTGIFPSRY